MIDDWILRADVLQLSIAVYGLSGLVSLLIDFGQIEMIPFILCAELSGLEGMFFGHLIIGVGEIGLGQLMIGGVRVLVPFDDGIEGFYLSLYISGEFSHLGLKKEILEFHVRL